MLIGIFERFDKYIDISRNDYGGSQTWLIEITKEFAKLGHTVHIFCNTKFQISGNIVLIPKNKFEEVISTVEYDKFIFSRGLYKIDKINADEISLMMHDEDPYNLDDSSMSKLDNIFFLSKYAMKFFSSKYGKNYEEKYKLTFNGIDHSLYHDYKKECMMVWSSCIERGYDFFLDKVFPLIKKEIPEFIVHVCQYKDDRVRTVPGIDYLGKLDKKQLAELQSKAKIWIYPNLGYRTGWCTKGQRFNETFCITAVENAYAGANIVCGCNGGLTTTLPHKFLIGKTLFKDDRVCNETIYAELLAKECISILKDEKEIKCKEYVEKFTWENAAKSLLYPV